MSTHYRILLVESDDYSIEVLERFIRLDVPDTEVDAVTPAASTEILGRNTYDVIVCDAYLRHKERVEFVANLCKEGGTVIIITGDTEIKPHTFSPHLDGCIHDILYKPLDLKAFSGTLRCAIEGVKARRVGKVEKI